MERPRIKLSLTRADWALEIIALAAVFLLVLIVAIHFDKLPETIPVHFSLSGSPDGFGERSMIWILPVMAIVLYTFLTSFVKFPHAGNYVVQITADNAERQYRNAMLMIRAVKVVVMLILLYLTYGTIQNALDKMQGIGQFTVPIIVAALVITIGGFFYRSVKLK